MTITFGASNGSGSRGGKESGRVIAEDEEVDDEIIAVGIGWSRVIAGIVMLAGWLLGALNCAMRSQAYS